MRLTLRPATQRREGIGVLLALCCLLPFTGAALAQTGAQATVLVLYDGGREFRGIELIDRNLDSTLNEAVPQGVTIFREYMDLTRIHSARYEQVLRGFYRAKYAGNVPDAIVAVRGRPLDFLLKPGDESFPDVPIVSVGMDVRQVQARTLPPRVTGSTLRVRYWPTLELALQLQPETERVAVVLGASPNDRALEALVRDELREHERRLRFTYLAGLPIDELLRRVAQLPPRTVILFVAFAQDGAGRSFLPSDAITRIARAANAPTYVNSDDVLDLGAVGGDLISFAAVGMQAGRLVSRVLRGERAADIPIAATVARVRTVDARQLARWGIPLARVPAGAVVLHRTPTTWELYRWRIVGALTLIGLQSALIAALLLQRRRRRLAERSLRASEEHGRTAVLEERNRMARDMHDTLAQGFTGVIVQLEAAREAASHGAAADTDAHIHRAAELARQSLGEARRTIRALRPQDLESGDLCVALAGLTNRIAAGTMLRAEFTAVGRPRRLPPTSEEHLLRIHQEILTNALRHSGAEVVKATLAFEVDTVRLEVQDDGGGFDPSGRHDGAGLQGMRERARRMGGELTIASRIGIGTRISVVVPDGRRGT